MQQLESFHKHDCSEYVEPNNVPRNLQIMLEHHQPIAFTDPYHHHASIELNFLQGCSMSYSFSGSEITLQEGHFTVFWAVRPHSVVRVDRQGTITNAYISLSQFLQWRLPSSFTNAVLSGSVLTTKSSCKMDRILTQRWASERKLKSTQWDEIHSLEIESRLKRLALEGWDVLLQQSSSVPANINGGKSIYHFECMLKFVSENFVSNISIQDVADQAGVSQSYAILLFRRILGKTIKQYLIDVRLNHAKMRLSETSDKILTIAMDSGFGSLSSFYEAFKKHNGISPARFRKNTLR